MRFVSGGFLLLIGGLLIAASALFRFDKWHELEPELILNAPRALQICDSKGELVSVIGREKRIPIKLSDLPRHTVDAFVSAEDARFYSHDGIDLYRVFGAAWADIKAGGYVQGASTISQQLIKLSHLSSEKTLDRKLEEAVLAILLERRFEKDEIMEMYLNYIYFGGGYYGIETAALGYFGVHAAELTVAQSAQLAGILKSPSAYAPHLDAEASLSRRNNILRSMNEYGYLSDEELQTALAEEPELNNALPAERNELTDLIIKEACEKLGLDKDELLEGGYTIVSTMESPVNDLCAALASDEGVFPSENAQTAAVVLDEYGGICAMISGRGGYSPGGMNRAVGSERQPGSLIKPILVYAPAMELFGYRPDSFVDDSPGSFGDYEPRNSDDKYYGRVTLRTAVARSLNIPAVSVLSDIGVGTGMSFASRMGIDFEGETPGLPMALGGFTHGVTPLEMAGAYSCLARGGVFIEPSCIDEIKDPYGRTVFKRMKGGERVMKEETALLLNSMLCSVVEEGTAKRLKETGLPLAAKTGTSVDEGGVRDAWCAAYSPEFTVVVWMGTDSAAEGSLPEEAVGGNQPLLLAGRILSYIYAERECPGFEPTEGLVEMKVDVSREEEGRLYAAGELTPGEEIRNEFFFSGSAPEETDPHSDAPAAPLIAGWSISPSGYPVISFEAENELWTYVVTRYGPDGIGITTGEISGASGYLNLTDEGALPGNEYEYRITAEDRSRRDEKGEPIKSSPSEAIIVTVPNSGNAVRSNGPTRP